MQLGKDLFNYYARLLKNVIEKLTKVVVEVELRYRVVVTNSAIWVILSRALHSRSTMRRRVDRYGVVEF